MRCVRIRVKYVDASAVLRILFTESGPTVPLLGGDRIVSSRLVEIETARAVDRERLLGHLDDAETARKRKELADLLARLDLAAIDADVIEHSASIVRGMPSTSPARPEGSTARGTSRDRSLQHFTGYVSTNRPAL